MLLINKTKERRKKRHKKT